MKFKNYIETESGIKDTSTSPGTAGQVLSSTVTGTSWIDQNTISSGSSEVVDIQVKNISSANGGVNLSKGDPVYIYGSVGASARLYVDLANADSTATNNLGDNKMPCVGLLDQDLAPNGEGTATVVGKLRNLITSPIDGATPNENDTVYVKSGGGLTLTKPTGSINLIQNVGQVGRVSTSADGNIVVAALLRSNDIPNLPTGKIWVGDGNTIVSDVVYLDETNERMGIGTTSPDSKLEVASTDDITFLHVRNDSTGSTRLKMSNSTDTNSNGFQIINNGLNGQVNLLNYKATTLALWTNSIQRMTILSGGNVGIGTTSPSSKLQVDGEIDANGADGYRINGMLWANESSNLLRLGDWDGNGFSTSVFDENSIEMLRVVDEGVIISSNFSKTPSYGTAANLVVGGSKFSPYGEGILTLLNNDPTSSAGDKTGSIQFAIKDDAVGGYVSSSITGTINLPAGSGTSGGGILDFNTSSGGLGSYPVSRMRINYNGNVGIGTTTPSYKLDVSGDAYIDETLNIETTISGTLAFGYGGVGAGHLVVGGNNFASFTPAVITLMNQDTTISAGQDLGVLQFGGKDDQTNGYANGQIICTTAVGAGSGNTGGGIFRFLLSGNTSGSSPTERMRITNTGNVGVGTTNPRSKLDVNGGIKLANDTSGATSNNVGTFRYRTSGNNSYVDMCMQTGASTYAWVNIVTNSW